MMRSFFLFSICLLFASCQNRGENAEIRYHDDGRSKPSIALVSVIDSSGANMPWDLSDELTYSIKDRIRKSGLLFLQAMQKRDQEFALTANPFQKHIPWIKETFNQSEFAVFLELVEHSIHPKKAKNAILDKFTPACELDVTVRIKVVDLRKELPETILQELVHQSHLVPKMMSAPTSLEWSKKSYAVSPIGFAHIQLAKEIVNRIEDYILLSKD